MFRYKILGSFGIDFLAHGFRTVAERYAVYDRIMDRNNFAFCNNTL